MATTASPEASEIRRRGRQRLIGAVAIVLLLVVFVPMVLDSEPRATRPEPTFSIPSKENAPPLPAPAPATEPKAEVKAEPKAEVKAEPKIDPKPQPKADVVAVAPQAAAKPADPPPSPPAPSNAEASAALKGYAVQVGAFRDEAKLTQAREKLQAAGVVHYTERLETKAGPLTRLRAGPFANREAAESALATLKRSAVDGKVIPLP